MDEFIQMRELTLSDMGEAPITNILSKPYISYLRTKLDRRCVEIATEISNDLFCGQNILAGVVVFTVPNATFENPLFIPDKVHNKIASYGHHAVVLLGDLILDPMLRDNLVATKTYIQQLEVLNPTGISIWNGISLWWDKNGYEYSPTIDDLKTL